MSSFVRRYIGKVRLRRHLIDEVAIPPVPAHADRSPLAIRLLLNWCLRPRFWRGAYSQVVFVEVILGERGGSRVGWPRPMRRDRRQWRGRRGRGVLELVDQLVRFVDATGAPIALHERVARKEKVRRGRPRACRDGFCCVGLWL